MNIFKVLAAREKFPEPRMSALLGWLMHPKSKHELGRAFLSRFMCAIAGADSEIAKQLERISDDEIFCNLEEDVGTKQIDVVVFMGDFVLAIENKIHDEAFEFGQLKKEFDGLLQKFPDKIVSLVYLVPYSGGDYAIEYNGFVTAVAHPHSTALLTWPDTVSDIIKSILAEPIPHINSIPVRTLITLEMLHEFIADRFIGYNFMYRNNKSGDYERFSYSELKEKDYGFVGVENGMGGLKKLSKEAIQGRMFPFDTARVNINWIPLNDFLYVAGQIIRGDTVLLETNLEKFNEWAERTTLDPNVKKLYTMLFTFADEQGLTTNFPNGFSLNTKGGKSDLPLIWDYMGKANGARVIRPQLTNLTKKLTKINPTLNSDIVYNEFKNLLYTWHIDKKSEEDEMLHYISIIKRLDARIKEVYFP